MFPSVLCGRACRRVYVRGSLKINLIWVSIQVLLRTRWYLSTSCDTSIDEVVGILHKEFHLVRGVNVLGFQSHHYLSGYEIGWRGRTIVAYSSDWLSGSHSILAGITFPPIAWPMTGSYKAYHCEQLILIIHNDAPSIAQHIGRCCHEADTGAIPSCA